MTDFGFSEILDLEYVKIDTSFKSASCVQPELMKVIQWMCVTLSSKVNRQGHGIDSNILDILGIENVRIDTKINFVSRLQPEIWKIMQKGVWSWFSESCNKDRIFHYHRWIPWLRKHTLEKYFRKIRTGRQNPGGVSTPHLGLFRLAKYLGHPRVNNLTCFACYIVVMVIGWFGHKINQFSIDVNNLQLRYWRCL